MKRKQIFVLVLATLMLFAMAAVFSPDVRAATSSMQKKYADAYVYASGQAYYTSHWTPKGILWSDGYLVDSWGYYEFTLPATAAYISYLDVGIYGRALSGNGLSVYVWNWATSGWDYVATTPTAEGHKYWGVSPTNHVSGAKVYRIKVLADDTSIPYNDDRYEMWYIDTYYTYTLPPYSATIWSWCSSEGWMSQPIYMDGVYSGYYTGHTFTGLTGTHTFTVPATHGTSGHSFYEWSDGVTTYPSITLTVTKGGTYTARYHPVTTTYSATIWSWCSSEGWPSVSIYKDGVYSGYSTPHTFTGLTGTHTFTVPASHTSGHNFYEWSTGSTSITLTVTTGGTYTARYHPVTTTYLTVTSPNGGEVWAPGSTHTITWSPGTGTGANVKIELLKGIIGWVGTATSSTPNDGSFSWTISSSREPGTDYKIRVSSTSTAASDTSDGTFTIGTGPPPTSTITVTSPNGGESWAHGSTHLITWTWTGSPGASVKIELLKAGVSVGTATASTPNDGSFSWTISSSRAPGTDYKVKITSTTTGISDTSNANFNIT